MVETLEEFYSRIWLNFWEDRVLIFQNKKREGKPQVWNLQTARNYIQYLKSQNPEIII